jgi:hypothetical protein
MTLRPFALALACAAAAATATCSAGSPAYAETPSPAACGTYREIAETLRQRFGESLRFRADENRGFALEFFAHEDGSWTLVMRRDDQACAVAAGTAWRPEPQSAF